MEDVSTGFVACFKRIRSLAWEAAQGAHASRVMVVGCGTGRLCFELSEVFDQVGNSSCSKRIIAKILSGFIAAFP